MNTLDLDDMEMDELAPSLQNIIDQDSLHWVFLGGKGGVGKTTTSCSLAVQLSKHRESVLLISTDPAHNISDAFAQKFSSKPTLVDGFPNLFAMEIDPAAGLATDDFNDVTDSNSEMKSMVQELMGSIPGIDEAMSFAELMKQVTSMDFSVIVFDTAPTGHTLRLLGIPATLEKAMAKVMSIKDKFSGMFSTVSGLMGANSQMPTEQQLMSKLESAKEVVTKVNQQFMDADKTTFICVCIPEFLSVYETERLVQELATFGIDIHNIVINQVLVPETDSTCKKCVSRSKMQRKYIDHVFTLYDFFHVTIMPQLDDEVRGVEGIKEFSEMLLNPIEFSL